MYSKEITFISNLARRQKKTTGSGFVLRIDVNVKEFILAASLPYFTSHSSLVCDTFNLFSFNHLIRELGFNFLS